MLVRHRSRIGCSSAKELSHSWGLPYHQCRYSVTDMRQLWSRNAVQQTSGTVIYNLYLPGLGIMFGRHKSPVLQRSPRILINFNSKVVTESTSRIERLQSWGRVPI